MGEICREIGIVSAVLPERKVELTVARADACGSCEAKVACHMLGGKAENITIVVENTLEAEYGDEVIIEMSEISVVEASAAMYLIPAINLVIGGLIGASSAGFFNADKDAGTLLGCAFGLLVGFFVSGRIGNRISENPKYIPTMSSIRKHSSAVN